MVGGSTAVNGGTAFRTPSWVLDRWCEETNSDALSPARLAPYFERVETHLGVGPSSLRYVGPIAEVMQRGCDALGWKHGMLLRNAPGCEASGFCHVGCRSDARRSPERCGWKVVMCWPCRRALCETCAAAWWRWSFRSR